MITTMIADGVYPGDILVLAQRGVIGTPIYEALASNRVPFRSHYTESELDSPDAQRAFVLLKLFVNRQDRVALGWLVGVDGNNWHAAGYRGVREHYETTGEPPWDVLLRLRGGSLSLPYTSGIVAAFSDLANKLDELEVLPDLAAVVDCLFPDGEAATCDIRELARGVLEDIPPNDREALIRELSQAVNQPEVPSEIADVRIMSLHRSKGLSAPVTIIAGCVEGLLPKQPDADFPVVQQSQQMESRISHFLTWLRKEAPTNHAGEP